MTVRTRRETMAMLAAGVGWASISRPASALAGPGAPLCPTPTALDAAAAPILSLLPEAAVAAGLLEGSAGGPAAHRCNDWSPDGNAALRLAVAGARAAVPASGCDAPVTEVRALLDAASVGADIPYGRNDPLEGLHRPYLVTAFAGPHLSTPATLRLAQDVTSPAALEAWQEKLDAYASALLGAAQTIRVDESAGCVPPAVVSRAALPQMDALLLAPAERHPLTLALDLRLAEVGIAPPIRAQAGARAAATIAKRVQPAMALLRDTLAAVTRRGHSDIGLWAQSKGEALHAANLARAGDSAMSPTEMQALARDEAARVATMLDRRLVLRGLRKGTLAERIAAAFAAHPEFIESDNEGGRTSLLQIAEARIEAARTILPHLLSPGELPPLAIKALPDAGRSMAGGSFYSPAAIDGSRGAVVWLDTRSVYALPTPGVSPIAYRLGVPGLHVQASRAAPNRPLLARLAEWPAMRDGWAGYGERLAFDLGLFAHDPWGDIARLSDELLRAARLVVDIGIHTQRWTREQAETEMTAMTGSTQGAAIDRILALPGEAASGMLGLHRLLDLRDRAKAAAGKRFDLRQFHGAVLDAGPRPFALVEAAALA